MFADPQSVTYNSVAKSLIRVKTAETRSEYKTADDEFTFVISHQQSGTRTRRMIRLDRTVIAADPLTATNASKRLGAYIVIDEPDFGFTDTEIGYLVAALSGWATSGNVADVCEAQH